MKHKLIAAQLMIVVVALLALPLLLATAFLSAVLMGVLEIRHELQGYIKTQKRKERKNNDTQEQE